MGTTIPVRGLFRARQHLLCAAMHLGIALLAAGVTTAGAQTQSTAVASSSSPRGIMRGDRLRISVLEAPELDRLYPVAGDGTVDMGWIGVVNVETLTAGEAAERIEERLENSYFKKATVGVEVAQFVEGSLLILGAVQSPGVIPFKGDEIMTLVEVIGMCGGLSSIAAGNNVKILRWKPGGGMEREVISVDVKHMLETLDFRGDQFMRPRDIVMVPAMGAGEGGGEFLALGQVGRPGFHPYSAGLDLIRAVARVGGISGAASMDTARLLRPKQGGGYKVIPLDLARLFGSADVSLNIEILPGDILFVPSAEQSGGGRVYLLGQTAKQGEVGIRLDRDTTLARLLLANGGVTKFGNASKVKILRTAPDGTKQTLNVDVKRILDTGSFEDDIPLRNEDVIIVPESIFGF
jgi:protein involved in polysaccharide export with SLBB domain